MDSKLLKIVLLITFFVRLTILQMWNGSGFEIGSKKKLNESDLEDSLDYPNLIVQQKEREGNLEKIDSVPW
ncbi:CLUMA_CG010169, isoform A [Clunio marinus]|uniref:CLUMA_CG010169, isoform A n=1 Tax=Clunio marinus TaxID=568069 RepID=A0A1J1IB99_9DIPT|nr:CLUMA_CG010169, isoform A [Clunio marinus]